MSACLTLIGVDKDGKVIGTGKLGIVEGEAQFVDLIAKAKAEVQASDIDILHQGIVALHSKDV